MNKRKKWGIIALVICIIGGIVMFSLNHQKEKTLEEKMRIEQDRVAKFLVSNYDLADGQKIERVKFVEFQRNESTGSWRITAKVNDQYDISVKIDSLNENGKIRSSNYSPTEFIKREHKEEAGYDIAVKIICIEER
ncbi:hypothetical protein MK396_03245 [Streptococcus oralis]|uniref:hypothetical protein n=1 Tax=Streptococcus oralis TaxID=1303 RepID=UPI002283CC04|nr:hypothetical protein [Streptococcus oralis]MCY7084373.1 hypothetical protein [Streptococcus oralis]